MGIHSHRTPRSMSFASLVLFLAAAANSHPLYPFYSEVFPKLFFANTSLSMADSNMDTVWNRRAVSSDAGFLRDSNDIETVDDIKPSQSSIGGWQWERELSEPGYIISTTPISISTSFTTTYTLSFVACEPHSFC